MNKKDDIVRKIKSKGYWEIHVHPELYIEKRIESRNKVKEIVRNAIVELRGWDYPHFGVSGNEPQNILNGIEKSIDWEHHIEFWRMTQSANFIHLLGLREDWMKDLQDIWGISNSLEDKKLLGVLGTLYTLTEIFEFIKRLARHNIFDQNISINIKLHNILKRELYVDSSKRLPFHFPPSSKINGHWEWNKDYSAEEIISKPHEFSFNAFKDLIDLFGWENPPIDSLKDDQQIFLEGKL